MPNDIHSRIQSMDRVAGRLAFGTPHIRCAMNDLPLEEVGEIHPVMLHNTQMPHTSRRPDT